MRSESESFIASTEALAARDPHSACKTRSLTSQDGTVANILMDHSEFRGATFDAVCPDDPLSSTHGEGTADDPCSTLGERHIERLHPRAREHSSFEHLYSTLVADGAVPAGYLSDFLKLEGSARRAAQRAHCKYATMSEATAEIELDRAKKLQFVRTEAERTMAHQLVMLADWKPRRFRTK